MKPTFIIAGCGKCGTTTLAHLLDQHPDVFVSKPKEPNFFSYDHIYAKGWQWYESLFEEKKNSIARGEGSVSYTLQEYEARVCERIIKHTPHIRIIYIARNPFRRLESVYRQHHDSGYKHGWYMPYTLKEAVEYRPQMLINSLYWQRTEPLRAILPNQQILYLCLEDLKSNYAEVLKRCFEFIGVDSSVTVSLSKTRLNEGKEKMYDTKFMRTIRTHETLNKIYQRLPQPIYHHSQRWLRKSFGDQTIYWEPTFRENFIKYVSEDAQKFLSACGKMSNFWGTNFAQAEEISKNNPNISNLESKK